MGGILLIGATIAHYRVEEKIGEGGMGEVYRARDTKLNRDVALKILPQVFAQDQERMARFEREAQVLASLNHSHIAQIYGIEEASGTKALVLELVEGETLADQIGRGPIPVDDALKIALQITEGFEAAHEKGIIHRDLKPANIKITPEGQVKILDFGLAKAMEGPTQATDLSQSPTISMQATQAGVILGTASYMSPEQARGKPVDKRTDIWAFGCVLFEMLTGKKTFGTQGSGEETISDVLAAVLKSDPTWDDLPSDLPPNIDLVLNRCLQKDSANRFRDIGDVGLELSEPHQRFRTGKAAGDTTQSSWWIYIFAFLLAGFLCAIFGGWYFSETTPNPVVHSTIKLEFGLWLDGARWGWFTPTRKSFTVSPDGQFIVYSAVPEKPTPETEPLLYLRPINSEEAQPIKGTEGGVDPFFSPDGKWIGFHVTGEIQKIPIEGGTAVPLYIGTTERVQKSDPAVRTFGASWGPDGKIAFTADLGVGLSLVSEEGGVVQPLTTPDPERLESSHRLPHWLPHGKGILFTIFRHDRDRHPRVAILNVESLEWFEILEDGADASYVSTGHVVFARKGTLMAVPFDLERMKVTGEPIPMFDGITQSVGVSSGPQNSGVAQYGISNTGTLVYARSRVFTNFRDILVWVDQDGSTEIVSSLPFGGLSSPRLSPDGKQIAYAQHGEPTGIFLHQIDSDTTTHITPPSEGFGHNPRWNPQNGNLVFAWDGDGTFNLYSYDPRTSSVDLFLKPSRHLSPVSWSPDGQILTLEERKEKGDADIIQYKKGELEPLFNSENWEGYPEFSPDGKWLAYVSRESGRLEVYVVSYPDLLKKKQISRQGGAAPFWGRDGKKLYYRNWNKSWYGQKSLSQMWVVDLEVGEEIRQLSQPRLLFDEPHFNSAGYDLSLDGNKFLMVKLQPMDLTPIVEINMVQNWFEELKRLVPTE